MTTAIVFTGCDGCGSTKFDASRVPPCACCGKRLCRACARELRHLHPGQTAEQINAACDKLGQVTSETFAEGGIAETVHDPGQPITAEQIDAVRQLVSNEIAPIVLRQPTDKVRHQVIMTSAQREQLRMGAELAGMGDDLSGFIRKAAVAEAARLSKCSCVWDPVYEIHWGQESCWVHGDRVRWLKDQANGRGHRPKCSCVCPECSG